jgi:hypothetical protein
LIEEYLHGTQFRLGIVEKRGLEYAEVHVKRFVLRHQSLLGISEADARVIERMLAGA